MQPVTQAGTGREFTDNDYCFACGSRNPCGLHLAFVAEADRLICRGALSSHMQGWDGIVHGGIIATVLDDLMSNCLRRIHGVEAVTAELTLRYSLPAPTETELVFEAAVKERAKRIWTLVSTCRQSSPDSPVLASAKGRFVQIRPREFAPTV